MSSLAELYVRPLSKSVVAEGRRNWEAYEREAGKYRPAQESVPPKPKVVAYRSVKKPQTEWILDPFTHPLTGNPLCLCGCGLGVSHGRSFRRHHRPKGLIARETIHWSHRKLKIQLSRIKDPLAKKVLLKELGRA